MLFLPKNQFQVLPKSITLLLPYYLSGYFVSLFNSMGLAVIHSSDKRELEDSIKKYPIDLAIEWQHGTEDYPIRDLLKKHNKSVPIFLSLNWNGSVPPDFLSLGYHDYLNVPWHIAELTDKFYRALQTAKSSR